ncbi:acyl-ACP desaturase [Streptomyces phytohabitans]|uniref:acyl-ACP desaturase n=1 Tax=Streptomyces phytohabitans TaxID=1150371 RepID=UPI00345BF992
MTGVVPGTVTGAGRLDVAVELEPYVARGLDRHLAAARPWFPHQYVPWGEGRPYDGPLGGEPWQPEQSALPTAVREALVVNLLTEDNLPSYHHEIARRFGRDGAWGTWVHRWTAEEDRHSHALRSYLTVTRAVDPVALEEARMRHLSRGYALEQPTLLHGLAYVTVQELATRISHRNTGLACGDPAGERLLARIAADENLHMVFYRDLCRHAVELVPDAFLRAFTDVVRTFRMPGHGMPGFTGKAARMAVAGIYDPRTHLDRVLRPLVRALSLLERTGLGPEGERARDELGRHLDDLDARLCRRTGGTSRTAPPDGPTPDPRPDPGPTPAPPASRAAVTRTPGEHP